MLHYRVIRFTTLLLAFIYLSVAQLIAAHLGYIAPDVVAHDVLFAGAVLLYGFLFGRSWK